MIIDACALIDFLESEPPVLIDIVKYVGSIYVITPIMEELEGIEDEQELLDLGLIIKEVEIEDAFAAGSSIGPTSFNSLFETLAYCTE
jgi:hypothetical protein